MEKLIFQQFYLNKISQAIIINESGSKRLISVKVLKKGASVNEILECLLKDPEIVIGAVSEISIFVEDKLMLPETAFLDNGINCNITFCEESPTGLQKAKLLSGLCRYAQKETKSAKLISTPFEILEAGVINYLQTTLNKGAKEPVKATKAVTKLQKPQELVAPKNIITPEIIQENPGLLDQLKNGQAVILSKQAKTIQMLEEARAEAALENKQLQETINQLQQDLQASMEVANIQKAQIEAKERKKQQKKRARIQEPRDAIQVQDLIKITSSVSTNSYIGCRIVLGMALLFVSGLRVQNLLHFKVRHAQELFETGETTVKEIKGGSSRRKVLLTKGYSQILSRYKPVFKKLAKHKSLDSWLFTGETAPDKPVTRERITKDINREIRYATKNTGRKLSSHSFRIGHITRALAYAPAEKVQKFVGHKHISTTQLYDRGVWTSEQTQEIRAGIDKFLDLENTLKG